MFLLEIAFKPVLLIEDLDQSALTPSNLTIGFSFPTKNQY